MALCTRRVLVAVLLLLVGLAPVILSVRAPAALAQDQPAARAQDEAPGDGDGAAITWGVRPSSAAGPDGRDAFAYSIDPGTSLEDFVGVSNFTDQPLELAVYASDAFTTAGGGFDLLPADRPPVDVGAWVDFEAPAFTVPPRSRLDIPFRLEIPANATPGDHTGGIVASLASPGADTDGNRLTVDRRVGARIYLRVTGTLQPAITVSDVALDYHGTRSPAARGEAVVTYTIANTGNVRVRATPAVEVAGPFGLAPVTAQGTPIEELLPGSQITVRTRLDDVAPMGRVKATVAVSAGTLGTDGVPVPAVNGRANAWAIPWPQLAVLALVGAAAVAWRRHRRRRRRDLKAKLAAARAEGRAEAAVIGRSTDDAQKEGAVTAAPEAAGFERR